MASLPVPVQTVAAGRLRAMNAWRDLYQVADLIEVCFARSMEGESALYAREMRRAARAPAWLRLLEGVSSAPLHGFVWEEDGKIVGNVSVIPFYYRRRRIFLIANVAVHPQYRRRGIARALTTHAMKQARRQGADELWLNVREDNPQAVRLYADLGFWEHSRRTQWRPDLSFLPSFPSVVQVVPRRPEHWPQQRAWLQHLHPPELAWYRNWDLNHLAPGLFHRLRLFLSDVSVQQWSALKDGTLQAVLAWTSSGLGHDMLWLALRSDSALDAVTGLLIHARSVLGRRTLLLEQPAGVAEEALRMAGFVPHRTLIWMQAAGA